MGQERLSFPPQQVYQKRQMQNYLQEGLGRQEYFRCVIARCRRGFSKISNRCVRNRRCPRGWSKKLNKGRTWKWTCYRKRSSCKRGYKKYRGRCYKVPRCKRNQYH